MKKGILLLTENKLAQQRKEFDDVFGLSDLQATYHNEAILPEVLRQMLIDIQDVRFHYWLYNNYFDILPPTDREVTRWWQAPLFLDYDSIWNVEFVEDAMICDVILQKSLPAKKERIKVGYQQIYRVARFIEGVNMTEKQSYLYSDSSKLKMPPLD
ncbi:hypothetical protein [Spirosoma telluris]